MSLALTIFHFAKSQDGVMTAAEPEVVASVGAPVADVAPGAVQARQKTTGTKKAPTVDSRAKTSLTSRCFYRLGPLLVSLFTIWEQFLPSATLDSWMRRANLPTISVNKGFHKSLKQKV